MQAATAEADVKTVRSHYSYDFVAFTQGRSKSWVAHQISEGKISGGRGRVPLREVLRLTELDIEQFTETYGELMPREVA